MTISCDIREASKAKIVHCTRGWRCMHARLVSWNNKLWARPRIVATWYKHSPLYLWYKVQGAYAKKIMAAGGWVWFPVCPLSEVNFYSSRPSGAGGLSAVRRLEVSVSRRLEIHYIYGQIDRCHGVCPLYGGCPHLGGSVNRGSTVYHM